MVHLIITEKPQAAKKIADAILNNYKEKKKFSVPYCESKDGIIVAPAAGHIFTLRDKKNKKNYPNFDLEWKPSFRRNKFIKNFYELISYLGKFSEDIIIATDLDIEGEVIGYNIYRFLANGKKVYRMEFSTLTKNELKKAYENKKEGYNVGLAEAGLTRHYLDYYYGVNISKAMTSSIKTTTGRYYLLSSGRVQGPALAILAKREEEIISFKPKPYWQLNFTTKKSNKQKFNELTFEYEIDKIWKNDEAKNIFNRCKNKNAEIIEIKERKYKVLPPIPFDLTGMQMEAYKVYGFTPARTQAIAQRLYLVGLISYPRTSSQKLPSTINYRTIISQLIKKFEVGKELLDRELVPREGKKTDPAHPAIYPTGELPKTKLSSEEQKLFSLIVHRFFAVFGEPAERLGVGIKARIENYNFSCTGSRTIKENWLKLYPFAKLQEVELPEFEKGEILIVEKLNLIKKETQPPPRYSQASLVKELEKKDLGTKSTRAIIVQTLYDRNYIEGKQIKVTKLGMNVVKTLSKYAPEFLSEELTAKFEKEMEKVENDKKKKEEVLNEAREILTNLFDKFRKKEEEIGKYLAKTVEETREDQNTVGDCKCGGKLKFIVMYNGSRFVGCSNYPKCKNSYPMPRNSWIEKTGKICEHCGLPILRVFRKGKRPFNMCLDPKCKSKENWENKKPT
ncbi:MAG TPA: DNA topoisomerase I [Candidatus Aenigmarchaeota archaeon]|nr:DNA topoisomerase I [Candidatus Aenigmarchaeota archaeon]